jgi:hypothetical protein
MNLDPAGAAELAEALQFIAGWPGSDPARLAASLRGYVGDPGYGLGDLRTGLGRFTFLLGGGEDLFGTRETRPPA